MDKEKIRSFLKIRDNQFLILLMLFTIVIRLYYLIKLGNQPIWWDEGDYLSIAKIWAVGLEKPEWWAIFTGIRPLFIPLSWAFLMKLDMGEMGLRFLTLFLPSVATIYLVYKVGKDLYNSKIGLIAGFIMSVYWVHLFYTFRLLTDIPALFLGMLTIYFFCSKYLKEKKPKWLYLTVLFGVLSFAARFPHGSILFGCFLFLLIIEKKEFFKSKTNWKALFLILLLLLPYIIYFFYSNFYVFQFVFNNPNSKNFSVPYSDVFENIFGLFPSLFGPELDIITNIFLIFLFIGIINFYNLIFGFDIFWKQKSKYFDADVFVILWALIQLFFYVIIMRAANDRWLLMLIPALFFITAKGFYLTYGFIKKYNKFFAIIIIVVLLFAGGYYQLKHTNNLIEIKKTTYLEVKLAGLWLKENTPKDAKIITASIVQNEYYSERDTYTFYNDNKTIEAFEQRVKEIKPDYYIINIFQPSGTPDWAYTYPQEKGLQVVKYYLTTKEEEIIYGVPEGQPILVIYKF